MANAGYNLDLYFGGYDLTEYFSSIDFSGDNGLQESSTFGTGWRKRTVTILDGSVSGTGFAEGAAATDVDRVLTAAKSSVLTPLSVYPFGDAVGSFGVGILAGQESINWTTPVDGLVEISLNAQSSSGLELLTSLQEKNAETSTGTGTTHNNSAATSFGGTGYLHVTAFTGTDCTISIRHSTDNFSASDDELLAFTQVTGANVAEAVAVTGTIRQYTRINLAGTFSSITLQVGLGRRNA